MRPCLIRLRSRGTAAALTGLLVLLLVLLLLLVPTAGRAADGFLEARGTELYLDGRPFYEISFNKFDLFWELLAAEQHEGGFGPRPAESAGSAVRELGQMGFKTVRVFCSQPEVYRDRDRRSHYYAAMDRMLDLCDRHGLRVVFCLGANDGSYAKARGETFRDFVARPGSKSRGDFEAYVQDMVTRYRGRKTIAMWEHANELLLMADIGGKARVWNGVTVPDLAEVARFHSDLAARIRTLDPRHLITTGDSFRFSQWHLYQASTGEEKNMWERDTLEQIGHALTMSQKGVDVFCVHYYGFGVKGENRVTGADGKPVVCLPADLKRIATAAGQPFYLGEYGLQAVARDDTKRAFWADNPDWFTGFEEDPSRAARTVAASLKVVVDARPSLTHWWCYQSDRDMDRNNPQRFDLDMRRTPELVRLVAGANRALQQATMGFTYMKTPAGN
jgi:hypothetical protein